jgi:hypothetical protein
MKQNKKVNHLHLSLMHVDLSNVLLLPSCPHPYPYRSLGPAMGNGGMMCILVMTMIITMFPGMTVSIHDRQILSGPMKDPQPTDYTKGLTP